VPKVTAWQCPHTDKLFASKSLYQRHLARLARDRREQRKLQKIAEERVEKATAFRAGLQRIADIEKYVLANEKLLWNLARTSNASFGNYNWKKMPTDWHPKIQRICFDLRYSSMVSNTHACPLNGVTNWGGRQAKLPRGYPGYMGSVVWWCRLDRKDVDTCVAGDLFDERLSGIYTGTGGGGSLDKLGLVKYRYGVEIFLDDWPGLAKEVFAKKLAGDEAYGR
jgi:hypothetical protein